MSNPLHYKSRRGTVTVRAYRMGGRPDMSNGVTQKVGDDAVQGQRTLAHLTRAIRPLMVVGLACAVTFFWRHHQVGDACIRVSDAARGLDHQWTVSGVPCFVSSGEFGVLWGLVAAWSLAALIVVPLGIWKTQLKKSLGAP